MVKKYKCAICKEVYFYGWTEKEAENELKENFGGLISTEDCELVCDDCYKKIHK